KRRVLGRMTVAGDYSPAPRPDHDLVAGGKMLEGQRQLRNASTVSVATRLQRRDMVGCEPMCPKQSGDRGDAIAGALVGDRVRGQKLRLRHRERAVPACGEPCRVTNMVGVVMRRDHTTNRPAL